MSGKQGKIDETSYHVSELFLSESVAEIKTLSAIKYLNSMNLLKIT